MRLAAKRHPDLVRSIVAAGHSIGGHTWDHRHKMLRGLSDSEWRLQIEDTHALLADLSGAPVRWFRPPWGKIDRYTWQKLRKQGITTVLWSVDGRDCTLREPSEIAGRVLAKLGPGDVVLLHDGNANFLFSSVRPPFGQLGNQEATILATDMVLRAARERDLRLASLNPPPARTMPRTGRPRYMLPLRLGTGS